MIAGAPALHVFLSRSNPSPSDDDLLHYILGSHYPRFNRQAGLCGESTRHAGEQDAPIHTTPAAKQIFYLTSGT
jgi:hypothetical protein